jgi:hypothetical protein
MEEMDIHAAFSWKAGMGQKIREIQALIDRYY